jgi:hypothetical protein
MTTIRVNKDVTVLKVAAFRPSAIFITHLPPAIDRTEELMATVRSAPTIDPFVGPDQRALEQILRQFEPVS